MTTSDQREETYEQSVQLVHWRKLMQYTLRYRGKLVALVVVAILTAAVEICFPLLTRSVVDRVATEGFDIDFLPYVWQYAALTVLLGIGVTVFVSVGGGIRTAVSHDIRRDGFANLQRLSFSYYDQRPVGWLMARMTSDCERLSNIMAWGILDLAWGFTLMIGTIVAMAIMNFKLAVIVLAVVAPLAWISVIFQRKILKTARVVRRTNSRITAGFNEGIMAVRTTKIFGREEENGSDFASLSHEMYEASVRNVLHSALYLPLVITVSSCATGLALAAGGFDVIAGTITVGTLIAFLTYSKNFFEPLEEIAQLLAEFQMAQASAERVMGLIEAVPEIQDSDEVRAAIEKQGRGPRPAELAEDGLPSVIRQIVFEKVSFQYGDGPPVLCDFDLQVTAGETIALVGSTGGGKSTIVGLLCRFYEPTSGRILIDGVDYRERSLGWLQSQLGIVLQTPHLFSGSVLENIRYGRPDATIAEVHEAARLAGAHDFVEELSEGYETAVGEGGNRLSTGQKQLLSFARAILAEPRILVMDEATSSVDTETEKHIQRGLTNVLEGRTSFVIAHRLSTIRSADRIVVIEKGRIVESGSHTQLMAQGGRYHQLYTRQSVSTAETW